MRKDRHLVGGCACRRCLRKRGYITRFEELGAARLVWPALLLASAIACAALVSGCATRGAAFDWADVRDEHGNLREDCPETHNAAGGYVVACGDLPGQLGDDC